MVGADEVLAHLTRAVEQAGAAVPAGVEETARGPVVAAHQKHRHAGDLEREVIAGLGNLAAEGERQRMVAEQRRLLRHQRVRAGVTADVDRLDGIGFRQRTAGETIERFGGEAPLGAFLHWNPSPVVSR